MKRSVGIILIGLGITASLSASSQRWLSFGIKGGFYGPSSSTFNTESLPPTNRDLRALAEDLRRGGLSARVQELGRLNWAPTLGGEIELRVSDHLSAAVTAEFWTKSPAGFIEASGPLSGDSFDAVLLMEFDATLIPVLGTLRYNISWRGFEGYVGGGAGLYSGRVSLILQSEGFGTDLIVAEGTGLIPHINAGLDTALGRRFSLGLDFRYVLGAIDPFTVREADDGRLVGEVMTFADDSGTVTPFKWELSGLNLGFIFKFHF